MYSTAEGGTQAWGNRRHIGLVTRFGAQRVRGGFPRQQYRRGPPANFDRPGPSGTWSGVARPPKETPGGHLSSKPTHIAGTASVERASARGRAPAPDSHVHRPCWFNRV